MNKTAFARALMAVVLAGGCSSAPPPAPAPVKTAPAPVHAPVPVTKITPVPQTAAATGQAITLPGGEVGAENPRLGRRRDGRTVTLADLGRRPVLALFWSNRCPPCAGELSAVEALRRQYESRGLSVVAVNVGDPASAADRFLARQKPVHMLQLLDADRSAARALSVRTVPTTLLFDALGRLHKRYGGYSGLDLAQLRRELDPLLRP